VRNKKKLTELEFDSIRLYLNKFSTKNIEAIRRILVDGVMQKEIATELGMSKEAVSAMVARAWAAYLKHGVRPEGWRTVEVVLPVEYAEVVEELANVLQTRGRK
jgi:DNA-binding MarR family transcriptional regulator